MYVGTAFVSTGLSVTESAVISVLVMVFDELAVLLEELFVLCVTPDVLTGTEETVFLAELVTFSPCRFLSTGEGELLPHPLSNAIAETKAKIFWLDVI